MTRDELLIRLRTTFIFGGYENSLKALSEVAKYRGVRKDGVTPSNVHQLSVTNYILSFDKVFIDYKNRIEADTIYASCLLHDSVEDGNILRDRLFKEYGKDICETVDLLTKTGKGTKYYYEEMIKNGAATVIKGSDRIHNVQTMVGVFTNEKIEAYIKETKEFVIPMLYDSIFHHPQFEAVYSNEILVLESQLALIGEIITSNSDK